MKNKHFDHLAVFLLRTGIALVFLYAAIAAFLDPFSWVGFFPQWLTAFISGTALLMAWSTYEILLAFWILSGWKTFWASLIASVSLLLIIIPNLGALDIIFRDFAILSAALALMVLSKNRAED